MFVLGFAVLLRNNMNCPDCQATIEPCSCGERGCALSAHLGSDCPSEAGIKHRETRDFYTLLRTKNTAELMARFPERTKAWLEKRMK